MVKLAIAAVLLIAASFTMVPYLVGKVQFTNVERVVQNLGNDCNNDYSTDGEIENVLGTFGFRTEALEDPTFADYYRAGWIAITQEF